MAFGPNSNDIEINVKVEQSGAIQAFDNLGKKIGEVEKATEKTSEGLSKGQAKILALASSVDLARQAFAVFSKGFGQAIELVERGSAVDDLAQSFQTLTSKAGVTADALLGDLQQATGKTISNFDLMLKASESLRAGLKPDEIIEVTQAARALAEETGGSLTEEIEGLTNALVTGNEKFLKTRGIYIDTETAVNKYAKTLGVEAKNLTEVAKLEASRIAILEALNEKAKEGALVTSDVADSIAEVRAALDNTKDSFAQAIANSSALNQVLKEFAGTLNGLSSGTFDGMINGLKGVAVSAKGLLDLAFLGGGQSVLELQVRGIAAEANKTAEKITKALAKIGEANKALATGSKKDLGQFSAALAQIGDDIKKNADIAKIVGPKYDELKKKFSDLGIEIGKVEAPVEGARRALIKVGEEAKKLGAFGGIPDLISETEKLTKLYRDGYIDIGYFSDELNKLQSEFVKSGGSAKIASDTIDKSLGKTLEAISDDAIKAREELEALGDTSVSLDNIGGTIARGLSSALADVIRGGDGGDALKGIGVELGGQAGAAFGESIGGPIGAEIGQQLGEAITDVAIDAIVAGFDTDSAGTKARKALDKFFAEALEGANFQALINDELTKITDLQFTGNNTNNNLFAGMTDQLKEAFDGVGLAIETTFGYGQELAVELGSVLANNVGGSLNNLQLLLESSGVSFENLGKGIEDAFLKGTISATEAQTALNAIQKTSEKGIPDALGAVVDAFDNLKNAGEKGGRVTVDALKDIAYEAKELNQKTLTDTKNFLLNSGKFTAQEIETLFKALSDNGVSSLDQLQNASTTTLIAVASQLEALKFPFKEYADDASAAVEQLTGIPSFIKTNLEINVSTKYQDSGAKQIVESGQLGTRLPAGEGISTSGSQYSRPGSKAIR